MSAFCNTDASPHFLPFVQSSHYAAVYLISIWIISQTSAWLWQALMTEKCRRSRERQSFAPEQLAAAVCLSDLSHFTTHIHQQLPALLCSCHHKTTRSAWAVDPTRQRLALGWGFGCSLWVVAFCGWGIWPCLVISLHLSFLSLPLSLCLFHTHSNTLSFYLPLGYRFRIKNLCLWAH